MDTLNAQDGAARIRENLLAVRERIAGAARAAGRAPDSVRLVAISKTFPVEAISSAIAAGQTRFGENRVQEAEPKIRELGGRHRLEWHLVGHLQSNKARKACELFDTIHSVDSAHLAVKLNQAALEIGKQISILLQVDLGHEESKFGANPADVRAIVNEISGLQGIRLDGLMTLPPFFDAPERVRPYFARLRELLGELESERPGCMGQQHLSMGMSHDFEIAVQEGATMVRIGSSIFGARTHAPR